MSRCDGVILCDQDKYNSPMMTVRHEHSLILLIIFFYLLFYLYTSYSFILSNITLFRLVTLYFNTECIDSLFLPLLLLYNDDSANSDNDTSRNSHYELISRVIKTVALPKESVLYLLSQLLVSDNSCKVDNARKSMTWSEHSIPILTSCFQIKPHLPDNIISLITQRISQCVTDKKMKSSAKFSTLFQTFVMKYGNEIRSVPVLKRCFHLHLSWKHFWVGVLDPN